MNTFLILLTLAAPPDRTTVTMPVQPASRDYFQASDDVRWWPRDNQTDVWGRMGDNHTVMYWATRPGGRRNWYISMPADTTYERVIAQSKPGRHSLNTGTVTIHLDPPGGPSLPMPPVPPKSLPERRTP